MTCTECRHKVRSLYCGTNCFGGGSLYDCELDGHVILRPDHEGCEEGERRGEE